MAVLLEPVRRVHRLLAFSTFEMRITLKEVKCEERVPLLFGGADGVTGMRGEREQ